MTERGFQFRDIWLIPLIFVVGVPVAIIGAVLNLIDYPKIHPHHPNDE